MQKSGCLERFDAFVHGLSPDDRLGVLVHCDPDGMASAAVIIRALQKITGKEPVSLLCSPYGDHDLMAEKLGVLEYAHCNKIIVADLSFDQDDFFVKGAEKFCREVLFIDHHKAYNDLNSKKTVFIKARFFSDIEPSQYPASKMCFDLFSRHCDLSGSAWIAGVGILGDASGATWKEFLEKSFEQNKTSFQELDECKEIVEAVGLLEPFRFNELTRAFVAARHPSEIFKPPFVSRLHEMRSEISFWFDKFKSEAERFDDIELVWFECKPKIPVKAPLVNKISFELYPKRTVLFLQDLREKDSHVSVSGRRQDGKVRINDLLEAAVKGIPNAQAGGHAPAAGGRVPREYVKIFKQNVIRELKKQYKKKSVNPEKKIKT